MILFLLVQIIGKVNLNPILIMDIYSHALELVEVLMALSVVVEMKAVGRVGGVRERGEDARRDTATARTRARRRTTRTRTRFSRSSGVIYNKWRRQRRWREGLDRGLAPSPRAGREGSSTSRGRCRSRLRSRWRGCIIR